MEKGKLLDSGVTAEVYEWGPDKILKLYFDKHSTGNQVDYESNIGRMVYESGIHSPAVYDTVEVDGRKGIIYERIYGKSVNEQLKKEPWSLYYYCRQMAVLQHNIHSFSANRLPTQLERFTYIIRISSFILGYRTKRILDYVESLPDGDSICHGDFYFSNIIVSGKKLVPVDWNGCYKGNPLSDVAISGIVFCSPVMPKGFPDDYAMFLYYPKWMAYWVYLNEYMKLAKAGYGDIDAWQLPVAAAKLKDRIPGEREWLMDIVDKRLELL
jgi:uncharacterized protein (TIGR02172 family)